MSVMLVSMSNGISRRARRKERGCILGDTAAGEEQAQGCGRPASAILLRFGDPIRNMLGLQGHCDNYATANAQERDAGGPCEPMAAAKDSRLSAIAMVYLLMAEDPKPIPPQGARIQPTCDTVMAKIDRMMIGLRATRIAEDAGGPSADTAWHP
jgi:hypothetical protein